MKKRKLLPEAYRARVPEEQNRAYVEILKKMINCKTVFTKNAENETEFRRLYTVIEENFPLLSERAERLTFGSGCFFYILRGERPERNILLMSHHDVVDGGEGWETDPFIATEKDGCVYGRGAVDTKVSLFAILMACEELLREGYTFPGINLYIGSSNNEEFSGDGMPLAAEFFAREGVHFDVLLDEGGAIVEGMIPSVTAKSAVIAVHEKGRHFFTCRARVQTKGHGGLNGGGDSALERLARFISEVERKKKRIYKACFAPEVKETFLSHVPYMHFPMNVLFGNLTLFSPIIKRIMMKIPAASRMLTTSVSFTTCTAGDSTLPQMEATTAEATMYMRCVREEDLYLGLGKIRKIAEKYGVEIEEGARDYCKPTSFNGHAYRALEEVLHENFPDVIVAPFLLTAGTDARRFTDIADEILRFAPVDLSQRQFASIHGENENIKLKNIGECVLFYKSFVKKI